MSEPRPRVIPTRHLCKIGEIINGRYRIVAELGIGAFGHVYKAEDFNGVTYALKVLHLWDVPSDIRQPLIDRFEMEYKTGRIDSDYLVHSLDLGYISGNPYIVMEFCNGGDLSAKLGKCTYDEAVRYAEEILRGLYDLHKNGKVHRDLKPENVLIKANGIAALTDFGISGDRNKRMTERNIFGRPYQVFGTYAYMPPEQVNRARGGITVLPTTDIFSFGVLMFQLITGQLPFGKLEDQNDLVRYQKKGKAGEWDRQLLLMSPNGIEWDALFSSCLQPDYKQRAQTVGDVMRLLPKSHSGGVNALYDRIHTAGRNQQNLRTGRRLRILQGKEHGKIYDLSFVVSNQNRFLITFGRDDTNIFQLNEFETYYTSRKHFTIEVSRDRASWAIRDGQWSPEDMVWKRSSNGTYVNSSEVTQEGYILSLNDIISVGEITMIFEEY